MSRRLLSSTAAPASLKNKKSGVGNTEASRKIFERENTYGARNYAPIPVAIAKGKGVHVWDVDGKKYFDFLSAYSGTKTNSIT